MALSGTRPQTRSGTGQDEQFSISGHMSHLNKKVVLVLGEGKQKEAEKHSHVHPECQAAMGIRYLLC